MLAIISILIVPLIALIGFLYNRHRKLKLCYKIICKKSSSLKPYDVLGEQQKKYGFHKYYYERPEDEIIKEKIENNKNVLIVGSPLLGKTRAIYNALITLNKPHNVIIPRVVDIDTRDLLVPLPICFWRKRILVLDDMDKFAKKKNFTYLLQEYLTRNTLIIASCLSGPEYDKLCKKKEIEISLIFDDPIEMTKISIEEGEKVAKETGRDLPPKFEGSIGLIFLQLDMTREQLRRYSADETGEKEVALKTEISIEREASCVLVYSERRHIDYIYPLLGVIESVLRERGFKVQRLSHEIISGEDYLNKLEKIIDVCVLGVIIIDGFRPNVLFEFGYLKGKKKPIIILQSKGACICVKTLYKSMEYSGLTEHAFKNKLKNPSIDIQFHFSDFSGKHIAYMDWTCKDTDPYHPSVVLRKELDKIEDQIIEETRYVNTRNIPPSYVQEFLPPLIRIIKYYYMDAAQFDVKDIKNVHTQITSIAQKYKFQLPHEIYNMIAAAYVSKAKGIKKDVVEIINSLNSAINIYKTILDKFSIDNNPIFPYMQKKIADVYLELAKYKDRKINYKRAIEAYKEALKIYNLERFPMDYAMTQNNLGSAYIELAEVEDKAENCNRAIKSFEEALKVYTLERFPMQYAAIQNNLGTAYQTLAEVQNKAENCKKAIEAFEEALKVYTLERFPMDYTVTQNNLGAAYRNLADVENKTENCNRAIKAYKEALKVRTLERFPMDYAMTQNNLGNAYGTLAEVEDKAENCNRAIKSFEEALKVRTLERFPMQYGTTQNNLGNAYSTLAEVEKKAHNCKKAIEAFKESLKVYTLERFPMQYAMTQNNLGIAYRILSETENKAKNCNMAVESYKKALKVYILKHFPMDYAMTQNNLGAAYKTLAEVEEKEENCHRAMKAYKEALKVYTKEDLPQLHNLVQRNIRILIDFCEGE